MSNIRGRKITTINSEDTSSTLFLVPALGLKVEYLRHEHGFVNAYLNDVDLMKTYEYQLYLLFKIKDEDLFNAFLLKEYTRTKDLVQDYSPAEGYEVLVYNFPSKWKKEWALFMDGEYSYFRKSYVNLLPQEEHLEDEHGPFTQPSVQVNVCNRAVVLKNYWERMIGTKLEQESEYWSIPDILGKELLDIEKIINDSKADSASVGKLPKSDKQIS